MDQTPDRDLDFASLPSGGRLRTKGALRAEYLTHAEPGAAPDRDQIAAEASIVLGRTVRAGLWGECDSDGWEPLYLS